MESDPIMSRDEVRVGQPGAMRKPGQLREGSYVAGMALLVMLPWLMFTLVTFLFTFVYEAFPVMVWALTICCVALSCLLMSLFNVSRRKAHLILGGTCALACFIGILIGMHCESTYMSEHSRIEDGAKYTNVEPSEPAKSHSDAVILAFSVGAAIDTTRAVGYKGPQNTYCVAPVLDSSGSDSGKVEYWAVGTNCCHARSDFECDDSTTAGARSCIVLSQDSPDVENYVSAIQEAEAAHGLTSSRGALLVRWVTDPHVFQAQLWSSAIQFAAGSSLLYLLASLAAAVVFGSIVKLDRRPNHHTTL